MRNNNGEKVATKPSANRQSLRFPEFRIGLGILTDLRNFIPLLKKRAILTRRTLERLLQWHFWNLLPITDHIFTHHMQMV